AFLDLWSLCRLSRNPWATQARPGSRCTPSPGSWIVFSFSGWLSRWSEACSEAGVQLRAPKCQAFQDASRVRQVFGGALERGPGLHPHARSEGRDCRVRIFHEIEQERVVNGLQRCPEAWNSLGALDQLADIFRLGLAFADGEHVV